MPSDLDTLLDKALEPRTRRCKFAVILEGLTDQQRDKLAELDHTTTAKVLTEAGFPVSDHTVRTHRSGHVCG